MRIILTIITVALCVLAAGNPMPEVEESEPTITTEQRIKSFGYPAESHHVQTSDGYVLTTFRIPYSPKLNNQGAKKPVAFLQHGLLSSSDCWILNGPDNALAFLLADAGYDVWMGNARGNTYSRKNVKISPEQREFWTFDWHEIAIYDMPAMIDYVLNQTNEESLHYVGHSQGTTVFFVLMSSIPSYNVKIKTSHMLAPVAFTEHLRGPLTALGNLFGSSSFASRWLENSELLAYSKLMSQLGAPACANSSPIQEICGNLILLVSGWDSQHLNYSLLPALMETHPAGSSSNQLLHFLQGYQSGEFRQFDHGEVGNLRKYGQLSPPRYEEKNIVAPVRLYYSDNDYWVGLPDVHKLESLLPNLAGSFRVPMPKWNHVDFLWALEVKAMLYDQIIEVSNRFEASGQP